MPCTKKTYSSADEAKAVLKIIKADPKYTDKEKKEQRYYFCGLCNGWHLTSITQKANSIFKEVMKKKREVRVSRTAEYWESKLNKK